MSTKCKLRSKCVRSPPPPLLPTAAFIHPSSPPRVQCSPSPRCASVLHAGVDVGQRGCWTSSHSPLMCQSTPNPTHPWRDVAAEGRSRTCARRIASLYLSGAWVLLWLSCAVCLIWDHGPWFLRGLRNIQPHPPIVKGGFASVRPGMFPAFTRQQSLDMCLIVSKQLLTEYLNVSSRN